MEPPHHRRFGSLESPQGALYICNDEEGVVLMHVDVLRAALRAQRIAVTPEVDQLVMSYVRQRQVEYHEQAASHGIPDKLRTLLEFTKKSKAVAYCKRIAITEEELGYLIHNCSQMGFVHQSKFKEFIPSDAKVVDSDILEMHQGHPRLFFARVDRIINERKVIHAHLLERGSEWHCFYFTYRDMDSGKKGHWDSGPHVHYLSHLWPELRKRQVWESFDRRIADVQGVHIRCEFDVVEPREDDAP